MLSLGIVGCGAVVTDLHAAAIDSLVRRNVLRVTALVDPVESRLEVVGRRWPSAATATSAGAIFGRTPIDIALISSPPRWHVEQGILAMESGADILVEKPIATNYEGAIRLTAASERTGRVLAVGHPRRLFAWVPQVRSLVESGSLGEEVEFVYREGSRYAWPVVSTEPFRRSAGGGVIRDVGVHILDSLYAVFGEGEVVDSQDDARTEGVESSAQIRLRFSAARGVVHLSWDQPLNGGLWLRGSRGNAWAELGPLGRVWHEGPKGRWTSVKGETRWPADVSGNPGMRAPRGYHDCMKLQWVQFVRAVLHRQPATVTGQEAAKVMWLVERSVEVASSLPMRWLSQAESSAQESCHRAGTR